DALGISNISGLQTALDAKVDLSVYTPKISTIETAITNINTLLASDDTTLDELQEIVDFIKTNKTTLDALGISNISGLQTALDAKEPALGNPAADDYVLKSTMAGVRSWGVPTGSTLDLSDYQVTWNDPADQTLVKAYATDTQSGAGSLLMDLGIDAAPMFRIGKTGDVYTYDSHTDGSNWSRGYLSADSDVLTIGMEGLGSGDVAKTIEFNCGNAYSGLEYSETDDFTSVLTFKRPSSGLAQGIIQSKSSALILSPSDLSATWSKLTLHGDYVEIDSQPSAVNDTDYVTYFGANPSATGVSRTLQADRNYNRSRAGTAFRFIGGDAYDSGAVDRDGGDAILSGGAPANSGEYGTIIAQDFGSFDIMATAGQKVNIYDSFTDDSNYSRGYISTDTDVLKIGMEGIGSGDTDKTIEFDLNTDFSPIKYEIPSSSAVRIQGYRPDTGAINGSIEFVNGLQLSFSDQDTSRAMISLWDTTIILDPRFTVPSGQEHFVALGGNIGDDNITRTLIADFNISRNRDGNHLKLSGGRALDSGVVDRDGGNVVLSGGAPANSGEYGNIIAQNLRIVDPSIAGALWLDNGVPAVSGSSTTYNAYGAISVEGNAIATTIAAASTDFTNKVQVTIFDTDSVANKVTPDHTNNHITISTDGNYEVYAPSVSFYGAGGRTYSFAIFINNGTTQIGPRTSRKLGAGGDVGALPVSALATLTAGDTVELWVQNEDNAGDLTVQDASLCVKGL
ncbi:MAG: hypothetical protein GY938_20535, partial [Ketobacter sp.]|nr:hypothetical protein [Ketobacter sp.]